MRVTALLLCLARPAFGEGLDVRFQDGAPFDRLTVFNQGCPLSAATITLDFTSSNGRIVIDTHYGGLGSRDPSDVILQEGNATVRPVADGDRILRIDTESIPALSAITVSMDVDDTISSFEDARVYADGSEIAGATIQIEINGETAIATLDATGSATLAIPPAANACAMS